MTSADVSPMSNVRQQTMARAAFSRVKAQLHIRYVQLTSTGSLDCAGNAETAPMCRDEGNSVLELAAQ